MRNFPEKLKELIEYNNLTKNSVSSLLGLNNETKIYAWLNGKNTPRFQTIVKLANIFKCSIDYLVGRTENFVEVKPKTLPNFNLQFKKVLKETKVTQYKLLDDKIISNGHLNSWLNDKMTPSTENIIKLADYLNVSIDYLVGRE